LNKIITKKKYIKAPSIKVWLPLSNKEEKDVVYGAMSNKSVLEDMVDGAIAGAVSMTNGKRVKPLGKSIKG
jgi:hypothetical protein